MIELKNINKQFLDKKLFSQLDYRFVNGKSYALVGASGSGKTTLLNIIGKLEEADSGQVIVDGRDIKTIKEKDYFKNYISYLFQNYGLIENQSIKENLELSFIGKKLKQSDKSQLMEVALKQVNLSLDLKRKVFSLSGGEAQRVAIAKTILKDSRIILADEPTASLDEKNSEEIINLILQLKNKNNIIIIASHDPIIHKAVDKILCIETMNEGAL